MRTVEQILQDEHERRMVALRTLEGLRPATTKLTDAKCAWIRELKREGHSYRYIARKVGVCISTVSLVVSGKKRSGVYESRPRSETL